MTERYAEIVATAQVGVGKSPPTRATEFPIEGAEDALLAELGALALMRRAGVEAIPATALASAPTETRRVADVADALEEALDESMASAREWARETGRRGFVAPTGVVSRLVPLAVRHPEFRAVLGERGRWLAGVMGVTLTEPAPPTKEGWEGLDPKGRARLIEELPQDDAELFTQGLSDRRKEVREAAAERLVRLPDSPQAAELRRMALTAVRVEKGFPESRLAVEPPRPEALPKWLPRMGAIFGMGLAAMALFDIVSHVSPDAWGEVPERMLDLAGGNEYGQALTLAWQSAALRFADQGWIDAAFRRAYGESRNLFTTPLIERASETVFATETTARLRAREKGVLDVLAHAERPFSPSLSREVVRVAEEIGGSHYALESFSKWLDPSVLPLLSEPWEGILEELRQRWHKTLDLRARLKKSLE